MIPKGRFSGFGATRDTAKRAILALSRSNFGKLRFMIVNLQYRRERDLNSVGQPGVERQAKKELIIWIAFICLILLGLAHRYNNYNFIVNSLWAEDGPIFFNGAQDRGLASLAAPYAGYLHVYARAFALVATIFPLSALPYVYFSGWLLSIVLVFWAIRRIVPSCGSEWVNAATAVIAVGLMLYQPHSGETILSLTNAQWWLALILAMICCFPTRFGPRCLPLVAVISLTGPFSILYFPVAAFIGMREKQWRIPLVVCAGAAIQIYFLLTSPRAIGQADGNIYHWITAIVTFLTFGIKSWVVRIAAIAFWVLLTVSLFRADMNRRMLVACAAIVYAAGLYSIKDMPSVISPIGNGSRYFVVPYALSIAYVMLQARRGDRFAIFAAILLAVPVANRINKNFPQEARFYEQYVALLKYESSLKIPLAPSVPGNDWPLEIRNQNVLNASNFAVEPTRVDQKTFNLSAESCSEADGVAVVLDAVQSLPGPVVVEWFSPEVKPSSARRSYPAGSNRIQIAFEKEKAPIDIRLIFAAEGGEAEVSNVKVICL